MLSHCDTGHCDIAADGLIFRRSSTWWKSRWRSRPASTARRASRLRWVPQGTALSPIILRHSTITLLRRDSMRPFQTLRSRLGSMSFVANVTWLIHNETKGSPCRLISLPFIGLSCNHTTAQYYHLVSVLTRLSRLPLVADPLPVSCPLYIH